MMRFAIRGAACRKSQVWLGLFTDKHHRKKTRDNQMPRLFFFFFFTRFGGFRATSCRCTSSCSAYRWHTRVLLPINSSISATIQCVPYGETWSVFTQRHLVSLLIRAFLVLHCEVFRSSEEVMKTCTSHAFIQL